MSRELGANDALVSRWANSKRPVSMKFSPIITQLVRARHLRLIEREDDRYSAMIDSLSPAGRQLMLEIVTAEIEVRVKVVSRLVRAGNGSATPAFAPRSSAPG